MNRINVALICILLFLLIAFVILGGYSQGPLPNIIALQDQQFDWPAKIYNGIKARIALNDLRTDYPGSKRSIFILTEPSTFTEDKLKSIFIGISEENKDPVELFINAYSNRETLRQAIEDYLCPGCREDNKRDDKALQQETSRDQKNHFAYYYRSSYEERFNYKPDPNKEGLETVWLKPRIIAYTGNLDYDLILAALEGDSAKVKETLAAGANVNAKDNHGDTALMSASSGGHASIVDLLLDAGADVNAKSVRRDTALICAASAGEAEIVQALLSRGATVDARTSLGNTALILAAWNGHQEIVKMLLRTRATVNLRNDDGDTALILAVTSNDIEIVKALIGQGANVHIRNKKGETALSLAKKSGFKEIAHLLMQAGAKK